MGAPVGDLKAVEHASAEALLDTFKEISPAERRRHATVFNYWLSIRGDRPFPPIRDLDPLEISDAGPCSILLEVMGGGDDADIRHLGHALKDGGPKVERISEAPRPSLLSCIANQLPIVASSRQPIAFEDNYPTGDTTAHCWVTLLPFSSTGKWIDYVYGFVSLKGAGAPVEAAEAAQDAAEVAEAVEEATEAEVAEEAVPEAEEEAAGEPVEETAELEEPAAELEEPQAEVIEPEAEPEPAPKPKRPGFSAKIFDALAGVEGFYGNIVRMDPKLPSAEDQTEAEAEAESEPQPEPDAVIEEDAPPEPAPEVEAEVEEAPEAMVEEEAAPEPEPEPEAIVEDLAEEPVRDEEIAEAPAEEEVEAKSEEPVVVSTSAPEGTLQSKLADVRSKADEARMAKIRSNLALYEGLSAAYDFALDAEESADEYLKLVEDQGLKIQLRSPMKPVVKLAFDGMCDDATISQLEAVLAWALKNDLPRGSLGKCIEEAGGIAPILNGQAKAA
jgi:hypothetical protein